MKESDVLNEIFDVKLKLLDKLKFKVKGLLETEFPTLHNAIFHHISTRMKKMRFDKYPYLIDLYIDKKQRRCVKSSVQSGKTEFMVIDHLTVAGKGLAVMYILPDVDLRNRFVKNRIEKMFTFVPYYQNMMLKATGTSKTVGLKHYGTGTIVYAGSGSPNQFKEIPADAIYGDELDQFNMSNYAMAFDRLSSSEYKFVTESANPTVGDYGIDEVFQRSDMKYWNIKCTRCNHWQKLDFFTNVVYQPEDGVYSLIDEKWEEGCGRDIHVFCEKCTRPIDRLSRSAEWVALHPSREISGYHISKLFSPHNTIKEVNDSFVLALKNQSKLQIFYNSDLGECFEAEGSKLTVDILNHCRGDYLLQQSSDGPCVMGVDVGSVLHVTIAKVWDGPLQLMYIGAVRDFEVLDGLIKRYNVKSFCVDAMPETRQSVKLCEAYSRIGYMCFYKENNLNEVQVKSFSKSDPKRRTMNPPIYADRLQIMDEVLEYFTTRVFMLPKNASTLLEGQFYRQLCTPVRIFQQLEGKDGRYIFTKGNDHFFHSYVYLLLARMQLRDYKFHSIQIGGGANRDGINSVVSNNFVIPPNTPPHLRRFWETEMKKMEDAKNRR